MNLPWTVNDKVTLKNKKYVFISYFLLVIILCLACTPYPKWLFLLAKKKFASKGKQIVFNVIFDVVLVAIFMICIVYITSNEYRPNIYFEF